MNLFHLFSHIVLYFNTIFPYRFYVQNIVGILNVEANALSRPQYYPTHNQIFQSYPEMASLPAYCVPPKLISVINA